jgi:hypothetical protein
LKATSPATRKYNRQPHFLQAYGRVHRLHLLGQRNGIPHLLQGQTFCRFSAYPAVDQIRSLVFQVAFEFANYLVLFARLKSDVTAQYTDKIILLRINHFLSPSDKFLIPPVETMIGQ